MFKKYSGMIAATFTPMDRHGELDLEPIEQLARLYVENGLAGVFVNGTTGECHSLTVAERIQLAERWIEVAAGQLPVIVHVGHNSYGEAYDLAVHAQQSGAAGIAAMAPCFFKPAEADDLVEFLARVADGAPATPFYYYDIPSMTGVNVPADQVLSRGGVRIPTLTGAKFSNSNMCTLQRCLALADGEFELMFGSDEALLTGLSLGVRSAVGSTYNYAAPLYHELLAAFDAGDLEKARRQQLKSVELVTPLLDYGVVRAGKAIMSLIGIDCGPVRSPLSPISEDETRQLFERIEHLDVFSRALSTASGPQVSD